MALSIVQHVSGHGTSNGSPPQSLTLGGAPTQGNLLIAFVQFNVASAITWNTSSWTEFNATQAVLGNSVLFSAALYRYVQHGDTASLPNFATAGNTYWAAEVYEISGVSGVWTSDMLATIQNQFNDTGHNLSTQPMYVPAGALLLCGFGKYAAAISGNVPTISGSGWTLDEAAANTSNFGGWGAASNLTVSSGFTTSLAIELTDTHSTPYGYIQVALIPSGAMIEWPIVRQSTYYDSQGAPPAAVTLACLPVVGNLLIADISGNTVVAGTGWTQLATIGSLGATMTRLYRYVQSGDVSGLPAVTSSSGNFAITITELSYVASTIGAAAFSTKTGTQASGATMTTTADTTPFANDIVLTTWANNTGSGTITSATSGYYWVIETSFSTVTQSWGTQSNVYPSGSSTVQSTATVPNSADSTTYIQTIFSLSAQTVGTIGINIDVAGAVTNLQQGAGSVPLDIIVAGVGTNLEKSAGSAALNIAVSGAATGVESAAVAIIMNIDIEGVPKYTFPTAATVGLNISPLGAVQNVAIPPGGGDVPLPGDFVERSTDWKRRWARWKELEEEAIAAEMERRGKIREGVIDAFERKIEGKTDPEPPPPPAPLPEPPRQYSKAELADLMHHLSIRKHPLSMHLEKDDEEALLLL